ncbi:MAG: class II aldolase/adducin family protein [Acidobacteriota bacterium]
MKVAFAGEADSPAVSALAGALDGLLRGDGHEVSDPDAATELVFNLSSVDAPQSHWRRHSTEQFGVTLLAVPDGSLPGHSETTAVLQQTYPALLKTMSNALVAVDDRQLTLVTPEMGVRPLDSHTADEAAASVAAAVLPLAGARFALQDGVRDDLDEALMASPRIDELKHAGRQLAALGLLPSPVALDEFLSAEDRHLLKAIFGVQQLSYGNLSVREPGSGFWMSGRGVDKARLETLGRDIFLVSDHDVDAGTLEVRVPPGVLGGKVSVDALEHALLYERFDEVGAILHVHAWLPGVDATSQSWPCGTVELASDVCELVARQADPGQAEVGLRNHGLTLTGPDLPSLFARIEGRLVKEIPPR